MYFIGFSKVFRSTVAYLAAAAYLLAAPFNVFGLGFCHGEDGHVELELVYAGRCQSAVAETGKDSQLELVHQANFAASEITAEHCGPCVDTPVSGEARFNDKREVLSISTDLEISNSWFSPFTAEQCIVNLQTAGRVASQFWPEHLFSDLKSQQTIVLLI